MSCHVIYFEQGVKKMRPVSTEEEYRRLRGSDMQRHLIDKVRGGNADAKRKLLQFNYSCMPGEGCRLAGSRVASNTCAIDIDHVEEDEMARLQARILANRDEMGLLMAERSARGRGYHVVFRRRQEMSQQDNIQWASEILGVMADEQAKDITRVFFSSTDSDSDLIFLHSALFVNEAAAVPVAEEVKPVEASREHDGHKIEDIIEKYWQMYGPPPVEGERNCKLFELACCLGAIYDWRPEAVAQVLPSFGLPEEEIQSVAMSACKAVRRRGMPARLRKVMETLDSEKYEDMPPPEMPARLPQLLRLLTSKVPAYLRAAVTESVFPALGTRMKCCQFRYWDGIEHEPHFMSVLLAPLASGKSCIKMPIECIVEDIRSRDNEQRKLEAKWKAENPPTRSNRQPRPEAGFPCQLIAPDATNAGFLRRLLDADHQHLTLYSNLDELDALKNFTSGRKIEDVSLLLRCAYDRSRWGAERCGADSVSGEAPLRFNFSAATTPGRAIKFFRNGCTDGTLSRINLCTIIPPDDDSLPIYGEYDDAYRNALKPYLERLSQARGEIAVRQANRLALQLKDELAAQASQCDDDAYRVFSYRALLIGWLKGCLLYVANGNHWTKDIENYVRWSVKMDMWVKMKYFGKIIAEAQEEENRALSGRWASQNILEKLPAEFNYAEYMSVRRMLGRQGDGRSTLRSWQFRGYISYDAVSQKYTKC